AEPATLFDPLLSVLDVTATSPEWRSSSANRRHAAVLQAFAALCRHWSSEKPLLLLFEDVHWFDVESRAVLCDLAARAADWPVLMLVTGRPELAGLCELPASALNIQLQPLS